MTQVEYNVQKNTVYFFFFLPKKHLGVLKNLFKRVRVFQIELEFGSVGF